MTVLVLTLYRYRWYAVRYAGIMIHYLFMWTTREAYKRKTNAIYARAKKEYRLCLETINITDYNIICIFIHIFVDFCWKYTQRSNNTWTTETAGSVSCFSVPTFGANQKNRTDRNFRLIAKFWCRCAPDHKIVINKNVTLVETCPLFISNWTRATCSYHLNGCKAIFQ